MRTAFSSVRSDRADARESQFRSDALWAAVDEFLSDRLIAPDSILEQSLRSSEAAGLPPINVDALYAQVALANIAHAGLEKVVDLRLGPALETLPNLEAEAAGPFDLVFIDADKQSTPEYFEWAVRLARPGSMIVVDNVIRDGAIVDANSVDDRVLGVRRFFELLVNDSRVSATAIQTVGSKGYDGFAVALVVQT